MTDKRRHRVRVRGIGGTRRRLTLEELATMRALRKEGAKLAELARLFGVSEATVYLRCRKSAQVAQSAVPG